MKYELILEPKRSESHYHSGCLGMVALIDFLVSFAIYVALMLWYRFMPGWQLLLLPGFVVLTFVVNLGIGVWMTALTVKYRDFRYIIPFVV